MTVTILSRRGAGTSLSKRNKGIKALSAKFQLLDPIRGTPHSSVITNLIPLIAATESLPCQLSPEPVDLLVHLGHFCFPTFSLGDPKLEEVLLQFFLCRRSCITLI